ncbi:NAD(P)/FAD-dependent oxidoreductase [Amycolatopsis alkalitolerans]|uniref:NAD(P)/FAD-dependent oxidoreductase n=1 Tax=Amycolatopsis alkalitolerans TaxID=2547244 RepID=A0A5C4M6B5_9PSEU|nr:NAD(P)/FAD-dependent oxidoreductase [Amycolatopsis alkalitolerans]
MDVRNPSDRFRALRARISGLGEPPGADRGEPGQPLTVGEWALLIDDIVDHAEDNTDPLWNVDPGTSRPYDAIFVGGGASGRFGAAYLRARGGRALIIDRWPFLGGSCPHQACVPHHLFSECARELDLARQLSGKLWFGEFDSSRARITEVVELFKRGRSLPHAVMNWQSKEQLDLEFVLNTPATVLDEHTVEAAGRRFQGENLVLCTGARTVVPDIPGIDLPGVFDFASLVERLDYEPTRCVIIGGSKVALEYGSFFQATGCQTTILTRSPLMSTAGLHHVDDGLRDYVVAMMVDRGIEVVEGAEPVEVLGDSRVTGVRYRTADGRTVDVDSDFVFVGTGERPDLKMYDALGLEVDERGFVVADATMRTSVPSVYAVGDLIGPPMEMFKARKCGMTAARNIMGEHYEYDFTEYPDFLHTTYEVSWCGLSEAEAKARYPKVIKLQMPPDDADPESFPLPAAEGSMLYAFTRPLLSGWFKLLIDADSRRIVGAHHVGFGAKDAFQYIDHLIRRPEGWTIDDMAELSELFLNPEHFIQLSRLRAGKLELVDL